MSTTEFSNKVIVNGLDVLGNLDVDTIDSSTGLTIGGSTATSLDLGAPTITTSILGNVVSIGETTSTTTVNGDLGVNGNTTLFSNSIDGIKFTRSGGETLVHVSANPAGNRPTFQIAPSATNAGIPDASKEGEAFSVVSGTYNNTNGATLDPTPSTTFNSFLTPTLTASPAVTTTEAANVYIQGAPVQGTGQTIEDSYALWVDGGKVLLDGSTGRNFMVKDSTSIIHASAPDGEVMYVDTGANPHLVCFSRLTVDFDDARPFQVRKEGNGVKVFTVNTDLEEVVIIGDLTVTGNLTTLCKSKGAADTGITNVTSDYTGWGALSLKGVASWITLASGTTFTINLAGNYFFTVQTNWQAIGSQERRAWMGLIDTTGGGSTTLVTSYANMGTLLGSSNSQTGNINYLMLDAAVNDTFKFTVNSAANNADISNCYLSIIKV